jgi:hypothetical protein
MPSRSSAGQLIAAVALSGAIALVCTGCGTAADGGDTPAPVTAAADDAITPLIGSVAFPPIPFPGSDGKTHLVYELSVTNFSSGATTVDGVTVLDADSGTVVEELDSEQVGQRLQLAGARDSTDRLEAGRSGTMFLHLIFDANAAVPGSLIHDVRINSEAAPPDKGRLTESIGPTSVDARTLPTLSAPLRGERYIAADGCCDAVRHTRAILPVNGRTYVAQRYAIDYEQADDQNRIFTGDPRDPASYVIFGREVHAVADGTVVGTRNDLPEQVPGTYPAGIPLDEADGNFVVLDIGNGFFVNYAHLQPGSIPVELGDDIDAGDVIGLVGNTGNSVAPHLHLHVMDAASPLASQGLPYLYDRFELTGQVASTADFDAAEGTGVPLVTVPGLASAEHTDQMILDQNIVTFSAG